MRSTSTGTNSIFNFLGNIHNIQDSNAGYTEQISSQIFESHLSQLAVIASWMSGNVFHIAWQSNYTYWQSNPQSITPIAHTIWDPHYSLLGYDNYSSGESDVSSTQTYSGMYHWMYTVGIRSESDLYVLSLSLEILALALLSVCVIHRNLDTSSRHYETTTLREIVFSATTYRLNYHLGVFIGTSSLLWSLHIITVSIPVSRGAPIGWNLDLIHLLSGNWVQYSLGMDTQSHIHTSKIGA
jgi:photosystem I P700 chlorophyll a apoprotein A2